jgi:hypothetical protein
VVISTSHKAPSWVLTFVRFSDDSRFFVLLVVIVFVCVVFVFVVLVIIVMRIRVVNFARGSASATPARTVFAT